MSSDKEQEQIDELLTYARNKIEGPSKVAPPKPEPYYSCKGCRYFNREMASTGGLKKAPTYFKNCIHPDVEGINGQHHRSLTTGFRGSSSGSKDITPSWCPVLLQRANDPVDLSDSVEDNYSE